MTTKQLLLACALLFALQACKNKGQSTDTGSTSTTNPSTTNTATATVLVFKSQEFKAAKKEQTATYRVEVAQGDSPQAKFVNKTIFLALGGSQENADKGNFNYQEMADDFVTMAVGYQEEDPTGDWSSDNGVNIYYNSATFISASVSGWEYAGGAHGNPFMNSIYFDLANLKTLTQKDLFTDEMGLRKLISPLLEKELKRTDEYNDAYLDYFADNGIIRLPASIDFGQNEVTFDFSHQELFDAGENNAISTAVKVPLAQVQPFLKVKL